VAVFLRLGILWEEMLGMETGHPKYIIRKLKGVMPIALRLY
jgi:hypothetical protein